MQLLDFFKQHPEKCEQLYIDSGDWRSTPNAFISKMDGSRLYKVGMYDKEESDVLIFGSLEEAVTDYVLFSLGQPRLRSK